MCLVMFDGGGGWLLFMPLLSAMRALSIAVVWRGRILCTSSVWPGVRMYWSPNSG